MVRHASSAIVSLLLLAACGSPLYTRDVHLSATPRPPTFDPGVLARERVATLGVVAPGALHQRHAESRQHVDVDVLFQPMPPIHPAHGEAAERRHHDGAQPGRLFGR